MLYCNIPPVVIVILQCLPQKIEDGQRQQASPTAPFGSYLQTELCKANSKGSGEVNAPSSCLSFPAAAASQVSQSVFALN